MTNPFSKVINLFRKKAYWTRLGSVLFGEMISQPTNKDYLDSYEASFLVNACVRKIAEKVNEALLDLGIGTFDYVRIQTSPADSPSPFEASLPYQLQKRLDVISYWYKLHTSVNLKDNQKQAVTVFKTIMKTYDKAASRESTIFAGRIL